MAIQNNQTFMSDLEFQQRFPELYKQQAQQAAQQALSPLGFGTPYQTANAPTGNMPYAGAAQPNNPFSTDINSSLNLNNAGVFGNPTTPSSLAGNVYGNTGSTLGGAVYGAPTQATNQPAFGNIVQPITASSLAQDVVGQPQQTDAQKAAATTAEANPSGMTNELIDQLKVAENARVDQVMRDAEEKQREEEARKLAEEAKLTPEQRIEKYTPVLQQQILGQQLTDKWSGQGHGSPEANARDMARILSSIGITDIKQFGVLPGGGYGNKETGQPVPNTYSERQTGNAWGGTFAGKGNTGYRVQFTEDGTPVFYTTYSSSSDLGKIAPLLAIASFIPALAPFAQGLNALIAAKQGNILGAIGGAAGLGGLTTLSNAANFAGALKSGNPLSILSSGANLGGTDLSGVASAVGLGGLADLNLGGLGVSDALRAQNVVKAVQSGNPTAIISALGGYAKDAANKDQLSSDPSSNELVKLLADKKRPNIPVEDRQFGFPSIDEDFASSFGLGRKDDLAELLPKLPEFERNLAAALPDMPSTDEDFPSTYAEAKPAEAAPKQARAPSTRRAVASASTAYDSVGGGRGGQGGATAEEVARYNAVRGNPPQSEVAKFAASLFPSAQAADVGAREYSAASQIPGQSYKAPASTYDQNNSMLGRLADELGLPQEFQRNVSNTLNALPGLNMPVGTLRGANTLSRAAGAADEVGAAKYLDEAGRYIPGSNAYKAPEYASDATRMTADPMKMFKMIQDLPNDLYKTSAVQNALKAIANGDEVAAFKALESNPNTKKELLKYAEKIGAQEVSPFKNINLPNPAKYRQKVGGGFANGGLASLKKRQMAKA